MNIPNLLSDPQKMPCKAFNIPAGTYCPAAKLLAALAAKKGEAKEGEVCFHCYAKKGRYLFDSVKLALQARADFLMDSLRKNKGLGFADEMVKQIKAAYFTQKGKPRKGINVNLFRVHDAGDLFSTDYIRAWELICKALPKIKFWFPTREYIRARQLPALQALASLPNVSIRPSAAKIDQPAPSIEGLQAGSAVFTTEKAAKGHRICPATLHHHRMGPKAWKALPKPEKDKLSSCAGNACEYCWIKGAKKPVGYMAH